MICVLHVEVRYGFVVIYAEHRDPSMTELITRILHFTKAFLFYGYGMHRFVPEWIGFPTSAFVEYSHHFSLSAFCDTPLLQHLVVVRLWTLNEPSLDSA